MKTLRQNFVKRSAHLLIMILILTGFACSGEKGRSTSETLKNDEITPPAMDLHTAVFMGNLSEVRKHIAAGTDLNKKDQYGSTPLISACLFGKTPVALALIEAGADVNLTNQDGSTPLHTASFFCRPEIVKALLQNGADRSIRNNYGSTALESVAGPFNEVEAIYDQISKDLGPLGLKLDYDYLKTTRPEIAAMLKEEN